jgi:hypothetical protein
MSINSGFLGLAEVNGSKLRCRDFSMNPRQDALFYDHIIGLRDNIPSTLFSGKGDVGELNPQKVIWRPSVKICQGGIGYPLIGADPLFQLAKTGTSFPLTFAYDCESARTFTGCVVNTYSFSITAGDIASITADIMAITVEDAEPLGRYDMEEKIVTWDDFDVIATGGPNAEIQSMTFTVNNNCKPIYTAGANQVGASNLNPLTIRVGMQEVSGSISYYGKGANLLSIGGDGIITISSTMFNVDLNVLFKPQERAASIGPVISQLSFVGRDYALGE